MCADGPARADHLTGQITKSADRRAEGGVERILHTLFQTGELIIAQAAGNRKPLRQFFT